MLFLDGFGRDLKAYMAVRLTRPLRTRRVCSFQISCPKEIRYMSSKINDVAVMLVYFTVFLFIRAIHVNMENYE